MDATTPVEALKEIKELPQHSLKLCFLCGCVSSMTYFPPREPPDGPAEAPIWPSDPDGRQREDQPAFFWSHLVSCRETEGEYLAEVAATRWPVLVLIGSFDLACLLVRFLARLARAPSRGAWAVVGSLTVQVANLVALYSFMHLLNWRSRRMGTSAARQVRPTALGWAGGAAASGRPPCWGALATGGGCTAEAPPADHVYMKLGAPATCCCCCRRSGCWACCWQPPSACCSPPWGPTAAASTSTSLSS